MYGADGSISQTIDYSVGTRTQFTYDLADRLVSQKEYATTAKNGGTLRSSTDFTYADKTNYLTGIKHFSPLGTQNIGYTYGNIGNGEMPDQIYKVSWNGQEKVNYTYDTLGRLTNKKILVGSGLPNTPLTTEYTYVDVGENRTTTLVSSVQTAAGTFTYTYDEVGNIQTVSDGTNTTSYVYDNLNQLVRENNQKLGVTITYAYQNGNITERKEYAYTTGDLPEQPQCVYSWGYTDGTWSDLMTSWGETGLNGSSAVSAFSAEGSSVGDGKIESIFDRALAQRNGGASLMSTESSTPAIPYDEIGNPTEILGIQFSWEGRQLTNASLPNDPYYSNVSYQYNIDGQRVSKTVTETDGTITTTEYFYNGEILAGQKTGDTVVVFQYDNNNDYFGFTVDGRQYYYVKNAQNDVIAITNADGDIVARYYYDAWGNASEHYLVAGQESDDASLNPFLYRSYYMDDESGFYYLNSRYYAPDICRFLNADGIYDTDTGILSHNMFAYCNNNPVNMIDSEGTGPRWNAFKDKAKDIWNKVVNLFKGEPDVPVKNEVPSIDSADNIVHVHENVRQEMYIHAENVVNAYSGKNTGKRKKYKSSALNVVLLTRKTAYDKLTSFQGIDLEGCMNFQIEGREWDDFSPEEQEKIAENMGAWDPIGVTIIGIVYGIDVSKDIWELANG